jgi:hypothetical protein
MSRHLIFGSSKRLPCSLKLPRPEPKKFVNEIRPTYPGGVPIAAPLG